MALRSAASVAPITRDLRALDDRAAGIGHRALEGGGRGLRGRDGGEQEEQRRQHDDARDINPWHHTLSSSLERIRRARNAQLLNIACCTVSTE